MRNVWFALGKNGKVDTWYSTEGLIFSAPLVEIDINDIKSKMFPENIPWDGDKKEDNLFRLPLAMEAVEKIYRRWKKFGPYGDLIQVRFQSGCLHIDFIGRLAFPKPALATDLIPIIRDADKNLYFIGITRKKEPGIGKPALVGGHLDIKGFHLETPAEALIHEAKEEVGLKIRVMKQVAPDVKSKPFLPQIPVSVSLKGYRNLPSHLLLVGTFETSAEEKLPLLGTKRIFQTTAYTMIIDIRDRVLTPEDAAKLFSAGDDAASIYVYQFPAPLLPPFAIKHHKKIFQETIKKLCRENRINI